MITMAQSRTIKKDTPKACLRNGVQIKFVIPQMLDTGLMLFGRRNYQLMEEYWPKAEVDPKTTPDDLEVAKLMNNTPKMVISRTLTIVKEGPHWKNVILRNKLDVDEITQLKQQPGKDIWVGGSQLAMELIKLGR